MFTREIRMFRIEQSALVEMGKTESLLR